MRKLRFKKVKSGAPSNTMNGKPGFLPKSLEGKSVYICTYIRAYSWCIYACIYVYIFYTYIIYIIEYVLYICTYTYIYTSKERSGVFQEYYNFSGAIGIERSQRINTEKKNEMAIRFAY